MKKITLRKHETYEDMYFLVWPDGVLSETFYNLNRSIHYQKILNDQILEGNMDYMRPQVLASQRLTGGLK